MHQTEFKIRSYGYSELAQLYRPNVKPQNAWNTLKNWIDNNSELTEALKKTGYGKCSKRTFTPYQVLLIVKYLGSP